MFEHASSSSSLAGMHDLPTAWAWAGTQSESMTFKKMSVGAIKTRLMDILLMCKERIAAFATWDQSKVLEEWQMASHNVLVEDALTKLTPSYDYVNVSNPKVCEEFIIKIKPTTTNDDVLCMVSRITNIPVDDFMLVDHQGELWLYPNSRLQPQQSSSQDLCREEAWSGRDRDPQILLR